MDDNRQTVGFLLELMDGGNLDDAIRYEQHCSRAIYTKRIRLIAFIYI